MEIGIIGIGNMTSAIIQGLLENYQPNTIHIMNRTKAKAMKFSGVGINIYDTAEEVISKSDIIILGIKPNQYKKWLETHDLNQKLLVSIAAGMSSELLGNYVNRFVITMPNTPAVNGMGTTVIVDNEHLTGEIIDIFRAIGTIKIVPEDKLDYYMLVTGCAPAYFFSFTKILAETLSEKYNLDNNEIESLLVDVLNGSGEMLKSNSAAELTENVCSPNGVTIEIIKELEMKLPKILDDAFDQALIRNNELKDNS